MVLGFGISVLNWKKCTCFT